MKKRSFVRRLRISSKNGIVTKKYKSLKTSKKGEFGVEGKVLLK